MLTTTEAVQNSGWIYGGIVLIVIGLLMWASAKKTPSLSTSLRSVLGIGGQALMYGPLVGVIALAAIFSQAVPR